VNAFVSGAGGFIGRVAVRKLAAAGYEVIAHVGPPGVDLEPPPEARSNLRLEIEDASELAPLLRGCDVVVHLAGPASVATSFRDPLSYVRAHVMGTAALVDAARSAGVERFILVSSAEVYGRPAEAQVRENAPLQPRSPYAAAKLGAEAIVGAAARAGGPKALILRPFSVYGPGQRSSSLLAEMIAQAARGDSIVARDLRPVRDYCHVEDVARAILAASGVAVAEVETFNAGTGVATSVGALAAMVFEVLGRSGTVHESGAERGAAEIFRLVADPAHAAKVLGWRAETQLRQGIASLLEDPVA
jgi:UDP-glucose 4-epimerase